MNTSQQVKRQESDRLKPNRWYSAIFADRNWTLGSYAIPFAMLGYFSIPQGEFSLNPFAGKVLMHLAQKQFSCYFTTRDCSSRCWYVDYCW